MFRYLICDRDEILGTDELTKADLVRARDLRQKVIDVMNSTFFDCEVNRWVSIPKK